MKNIATALLKAQKEMGNAIKDSKNPFFKSSYADLNAIREACMPALNNNGIVVLQPIVHIDGKNFVKTVLLHESGETFESLTEIVYSKQNDAQAQGSGITYARRYGLQSIVNIGAEDDDGNKASNPQQQQAFIPLVEYKSKLEACGTKAAIRNLFVTFPKNIKDQLKDYAIELAENKPL
jgi:hypothetical protein